MIRRKWMLRPVAHCEDGCTRSRHVIGAYTIVCACVRVT